MKRSLSITVAVLSLLFAIGVPAAYAVLERVGPVATTNGYPTWYQDKSGVALEFCQPQNQAELDGGWCLLLPGDTTVPEVFPANFADEHFYWAGDAAITFTRPGGATSRARLILGLEAAFAQGPVVQGDQVTFGRIRVNIQALPYSGTYTVYHPFGAWTFPDQVAGERLFFTEDIGFNCPAGQFDCALASNLGPFLLPSLAPGGAELPPVSGPVPGKLYIADPARLGPVTGSPVGQNYFRVVGPNGFDIQTSDFTLMGRVMTSAIAGKVTVDRATYASSAAGNKLDVFATAFPTTQGRIPASPKPAAVTPVLAFYPAACIVDPTTNALTEPEGVPVVQMFNAGNNFWGQSQPAVIPPAVCVEDYTARDAAGQVVPAFFQATVTDQITITEALYDPLAGGVLSVKATSSDETNVPLLTLAGSGDLTTGQITVTPLAAPPAKVRVLSSNGGLNESQVTTLIGALGGGGIPVAGNDEVTIDEDTPAAVIDVLANDTLNGLPIATGPGVLVTITGAPRLGTAVVDADNRIQFVPNANANGTEGIAYTVTVNGAVSPIAYVTIFINPVNDLPVAVDDSTSAVVGVPATMSVLTNDTDIDGPTDLGNAVVVTGSPELGVSPGVKAGGLVDFTPTSAGTFTFTYQAQDQALALSTNTASVTVTVAAAETINIQQATFRTTARRWIISGTDSVQAGQTLTIAYANGPATGTVIGTAVVDVAGNWLLDERGVSGVLNPTTLNPRPTQIRVTSPLGGAAIRTITIRN